MYKVNGENGLEFPLYLDTLKEWAQSGRLQAGDFVLDTSANERIRADKIPGLENTFADLKLRSMTPISVSDSYTPKRSVDERAQDEELRSAPTQKPAGSSSASLLRVLGLLLLLGGAGWGINAYLNFDTGVDVPQTTIMGTTIGGGRVNNIGLMQEKQNRITIGGFTAIVGVLLIIAGEIAQRNENKA